MSNTFLHKVYGCIVAAVLILALFVGISWFKAHDAWKDFQKDLAVSQEREKNNKAIEKQAAVTETNANKQISNSVAANTVIDADTKKRLDSVQAQLNSKPDSAAIRFIIQEEIPKLQIQQTTDKAGNAVLAVADTQENRDILNQADGSYKSCRFNLDDCTAKQLNFLDIIKQKDIVIAAKQQSLDAKQSTIDDLGKDLKRATTFGKGGNIWARTGRVVLPIACTASGAYIASRAKADAKGVVIAAGVSGGLCAFSFHF